MSGKEHTFKRFDQELTHLNSVVLRMGGLVENQIAKAVTALREADLEAARNVVARDHVVNFLDVQADEQIVNLLALRQPVGKDLRMILSLGKTVTDLERIGDELDSEFQAALRRLSTYTMEDARNVGHTINVTFIVKSLERIGDHAKNITEYVVFLVKGKDVRHVSPGSIDTEELDR